MPMEGPHSRKEFFLSKDRTPNTIWITGYEISLINAEQTSSLPQSYQCHSTILRNGAEQLVALSQGQESIRFPQGFGIPVLGNESLTSFTQVLNLNNEKLGLRYKSSLHILREAEIQGALKPLFTRNAIAIKKQEKVRLFSHLHSWRDFFFDLGYLLGVNCKDKNFPVTYGPLHQRDCHHISDDFESLHWVVKPGRDVNRNNVTQLMPIPYDTTIHYIAVHLHPFGESLELRDITANKTIFKSYTKNYPDKAGIQHVDYYSSQEGIPIYKDHDYELIRRDVADANVPKTCSLHLTLEILHFGKVRNDPSLSHLLD